MPLRLLPPRTTIHTIIIIKSARGGGRPLSLTQREDFYQHVFFLVVNFEATFTPNDALFTDVVYSIHFSGKTLSPVALLPNVLRANQNKIISEELSRMMMMMMTTTTTMMMMMMMIFFWGQSCRLEWGTPPPPTRPAPASGAGRFFCGAIDITEHLPREA